ncbi:MAG: hypothetical protein ABFS37_11185, partial [Acidobacteriota bacterium]
FREAYSQRFPGRNTPFVFLSSLGEPEQLVRGLEAEVCDYLVKPIDPRVLQAKVRSLLKRRERRDTGVFQGDLGLFPFIKVVQFCEQQGLTGTVTFSTDVWQAVVPFKAGTIQLDDIGNANDVVGVSYDFDEIESPDEIMERLYDLEQGRFTIRPGEVDFSSLGGVAVVEAGHTEAPRPQTAMPMGRLSGVKVGQRLFQIQTEMVLYPEERIVTVVILDGNTVLKRSLPVEAPGARSELEVLIGQQHQEVKAEVERKIGGLGKVKSSEVGSETQGFYGLFDAGFEAYRKGDVEEALKFWLEAQVLKPDDPTLEINLKIARAKLEAR